MKTSHSAQRTKLAICMALACCLSSFFVANGQVYVGKDPNELEKSEIGPSEENSSPSFFDGKNKFFSRKNDKPEKSKFIQKWFDNIDENKKERQQTYYVDQEWMTGELDEEQSYLIPSYYQRLQVILKSDKVIYRPSDVIFIEALVVDAFNKTPVAMDPESDFYYNYYATLEIFDPTDSSVYTDYQYAQNSTASFAYKLPEDASGGQYMIKVGSYNMPTARLIVRVQDYARPALNVIVSLDADSYFPGETVGAKVKVSNLDGTAFDEDLDLSYSVNFEDSTVSEQDITIDKDSGEQLFQFSIPSDSTLLYTTIGLSVSYGSLTEVASKTVVIVNPDLITIDFNPATGLYVNELVNKVYFAAFINSERYDVVDFKNATLVKNANSPSAEVLVEEIDSLHKGKGFFEFTPTELGSANYSLQIPVGDSDTVITRRLPTRGHEFNEVNFKVKSDNNVLKNNENMKVVVTPNSLVDWEESIYILTVSLKEEILYSEQFQFGEKLKDETITIRDDQMDIPNGGTVQVGLYKLSNEIIAYAEYLNENGYEVDEENTSGGTDGVIEPLDPVDFPVEEDPDEPKRGDGDGERDRDGNRRLKGLFSSKKQKDQDLPAITASETRPNIYEWRMPKGEMLVFIKPKDQLDLTIKTKQEIYEPGDMVEFEVVVKDSTAFGDGKVETLVSVIITDDSVYQRLEDKLQPPSFGSAVYLAYDVLNYNYHFNYANYYLEHIFGDKNVEYSSDLNLELLLATQTWRYGIFDLPTLRELQNTYFEMTDEQKSQVDNLLGSSLQPEFTDIVWFFDGEIPPFVRDNDDGAVDEGATTTTSSETVRQDPNGADEVDLSELPTDYMTGIAKDTKFWAHELRDGYDPTMRVDKTETQFYTALTKIEKGNKFEGSFYLSDLVTKFRITANALDTKGRIGYAQSSIQTQLPFYLIFEMPPAVTVGDVMQIPVSVKNNGPNTMTFALTAETEKHLSGFVPQTFAEMKVKSGKTETVNVEVTANFFSYSTYLYITGVAVDTKTDEQFTDSYISYTSVVSRGFPRKNSGGGFIGSAVDNFDVPNEISYSMALPFTMEENSYAFELKIMSSNLASLLEAIQSLIGTPTGCFEQTSATSYPMVMGLQFLDNYPVQDETIDSMRFEIQSKLKPAYKKLTSYQTKDDGYEWFGAEPAHEALTAYGLMQFVDMEGVVDFVDTQMVDDTISYLMSRKNNDGGFDLNEKSLDTFGGAPVEVNNAYIVWALVSSGQTEDLDDQIDALIDFVDASLDDNTADPYMVGLLADICYKIGDIDLYEGYADDLLVFQQGNGMFTGATTSVTSSRGSNLDLETTAIALLALLNDQSFYSSEIKSAVEWVLTQVKKGGSYGATQSTILVLKALNKYMENFVEINGRGDFALYINDEEVERISFNRESREAIKFDISDYIEANPSMFAPGSDLVFDLAIENFQRRDGSSEDFQLVYAIESTYYDKEPEGETSELTFSVQKKFTNNKLGRDSATGDGFKYRIKLENLMTKGSGMAVVIFRLPSCLEVNFELLDTLLGNGEIDMYEVMAQGTEIVLYFTSLMAEEEKQIDLEMVQAYAGECYEKPHNAYLYYNDDKVAWVLAE